MSVLPCIVAESEHDNRCTEIPEYDEPKRVLGNSLELAETRRRRRDDAKEDTGHCRRNAQQTEPSRGDAGAENGN